MNILITGGAGFLGHELCGALLSSERLTVRSITLTDINPPIEPWTDERVNFVQGNLTETAGRVVNAKLDLIFALHGIMSGQSETDYDLGMSVNLNSTMVLLDAVRHHGSSKTRFVFTSTVAVYGGDYPIPATEDFIPKPQSSYGTAKAAVELLVNDYTRRSWLDGRIFRIPTVSIRPGKPSSAASSYVSGIVREPLQGIAHVCPVDKSTASWLCPPRTILQNLIHGALLDGDKFGPHSRTVNLPGISVTVEQQIKALENVAPQAIQHISFQPDMAVRAIVDTWIPELDTRRAFDLGFHKAASFETAIKDFIRNTLRQDVPSTDELLADTDYNTTTQKMVDNHPQGYPELVKDLDAQETLLRFSTISHEDCLKLGLSLLEAVRSLPESDIKPVEIDVELGGACVFHYAMPGTTRDNAWWIQRKQRTVKHFGKSSYRVGRALAAENKSWTSKYTGLEEGDYAAHGGCFPIRLESGVVVGTITMSGLAQVLDHVTIVRVLHKHLEKA